MTRDDVIRMAREAGFGPASAWDECYQPFERFAALVAQQEREACASVCDAIAEDHANLADKCAAAIRARGNQ